MHKVQKTIRKNLAGLKSKYKFQKLKKDIVIGIKKTQWTCYSRLCTADETIIEPEEGMQHKHNRCDRCKRLVKQETEWGGHIIIILKGFPTEDGAEAILIQMLEKNLQKQKKRY